MKTFGLGLGFAMVVAVFGVGAATAQDLTAEQITEAFKKQKTRGLVIVPAAGAEATADAAEGAETTVVPAGYVPVAKEDQINIQIKFDFDSAALREDQKSKLGTMCEVMKSMDVNLYQIVGHTDSSGSAAYNENLSLLRAQEVKRYMVSNCAIPEDRLQAIGLGESLPLDANDPRSDVNRRVEFQALG